MGDKKFGEREKRMQMSCGQRCLIQVPMAGMLILDLRDLFQVPSVTSVLSAINRLLQPSPRLVQNSFIPTGFVVFSGVYPCSVSPNGPFLKTRDGSASFWGPLTGNMSSGFFCMA